MGFSKRPALRLPLAPIGAGLLFCALGSGLNASVVPISPMANRRAAFGNLAYGDDTIRDVASLLAITTDRARNTAPMGLGKVLQDASSRSDQALLDYRALVLFGSGSNEPMPLETDYLPFASVTLELGSDDFTPAFRVGFGQVNPISAGDGADFAAFDANRMASLDGWESGNVAFSSALLTENERASGVLTASTYSIDGLSTTSADETINATTAVKTWNGGSGSNNDWSSSNNWGGTGAPVAGDSLTFGGSTRLTPNNNLTADTSLAGITFSAGAGAFILGGNRITLGGNVTNSSTALQTINLAMILSGTRTFTTSTGGGDLTINGILSETGGVRGITKAGLGTLTLSAANSYTGLTTVSAGVLNIRHNTGLGTIAGGTTITSGATLQLQNNITVGNEALTIRGAGATGQNGALVNVSGTNNYGGLLTLGATSTISSNSGTLNLTNGGTITGATFGLTLQGSGNGTVASIIGTTSGTLTKSGTGTWTLTGANTFTGATTVNGGTLTLAGGSTGALGFTSGITVNSGGILLLGANNQINNLASLTLAGGTFARGNFNEGSLSSAGLGALNLAAAGSHLDFGMGTVGILNFMSFAPGSFTLTIDNWTGTAGAVGGPLTDRLIFASNQSGNLSRFDFTGFAAGAVAFDLGGGYWEIVPVPEAETYFSGFIVLALILLHHRKQIRQLVRRRRGSSGLRFSAAHGTGVAS